MPANQTALGRLLQERREAAGYSRTRVGELVGISPGTIEGWELGRVAKPPIHDVVRLAHFLGIAADELQRAVFDDAGEIAPGHGGEGSSTRRPRRRDVSGIPLLDAAYRLLGWRDDADAAAALNVEEGDVRAWRSGQKPMAFSDYLALTSIVGVAAAAAMKGDRSKHDDLTAAAALLGVGMDSSD